MPEPAELSILGHSGQPLPHLYRPQPAGRQPGAAALALLLPGLGYRLPGPALLYPAEALSQSGHDLLALNAVYTVPEFMDAPDPEQLAWLTADVTATWAAARAQRDYIHLTLLGKSLGSVSMAQLLTAQLAQPLPASRRLVWLTPLLRQPPVVAALLAHAPDSLVVIGTSDPHYLPEVLAEVQAAGAEVLTLPGADHSLLVAGDVQASLAALGQLVGAVGHFGSGFSNRRGIAQG